MTNRMAKSSWMTNATQVGTNGFEMWLQAYTYSSKTESPLLCTHHTSFLHLGFRFRSCIIHLELLGVS